MNALPNPGMDSALAQLQTRKELIEFLSDVLPPLHPGEAYIIATLPGGYKDLPENKRYMNHYYAGSIDELADRLIKFDGQGLNVFFAQATFTKHEKPARDQNNVVGIGVLRADFDVVAPDDSPEMAAKKYATRDEARMAVEQYQRDFMQATRIISSGDGFHLYWTLNQTLTREAWDPLAIAFKAHMTACGVKADHTITTNSAALLRPVHTHNRKYRGKTPLEVTVVAQGEHVALEAVRAKLADVEPAKGRTPAFASNIDLSSGEPERWFDPLSSTTKVELVTQMLAVLGPEIQDDRAIAIVKIGAALRGVAGVDQEILYGLWKAWATQKPKWVDQWDDTKERKRFEGFKGTGPGVLIKLAREHGWVRRAQTYQDRFASSTQAGEFLRENYVYIRTLDAFRDANGCLLSVTAFNRSLARLMPKPESQSKATSANHIAMELGFVEQTDCLGYAPAEGRIFKFDGLSFANTYRPWTPHPLNPEPWETRAFLGLINHLASDDKEARAGLNYILKCMAWLVQNPSGRIPKGLLLIGPTPGSGKTSLMLVIPRLLFGPHNVNSPTDSELNSDFNGYAQGARILTLEEIWMAQWRDAESRANRFKALLSDDGGLRVHAKGRDGFSVKNVLSVFATSNYPDAIHVQTSDRRWHIVDTNAPAMSVEQADELYTFLKSERAPGVLRYVFLKMDVSKFNPHKAPPMSAAKLQAIEIGRSEHEAKIIGKWEDKSGCFARDVVTVEEVQKELGTLIFDRPVARNAIIKVLLSEPIKAKAVLTSKWEVEIQKSTSVRAYVVRNEELWIAAGGSAMYDELHKAIK